MTNKVFKRTTDNGHASLFRSRVSGPVITIEIINPLSKYRIVTTLSKEDAKRYAEWILSKCI